jgi:cytochrome c peroxidase
MFLFAEVGCHGCHTAPLFESARYESRGIPGDVLDEGRWEVTGDEADRGAFRVPTLRNARESGPYFHDGSIVELRDAVAWESQRQAESGSARALDENEIELVTRFIDKGLTDKTRDPKRPKTVPSGLTVPVDGFRIPR